MILTWDIYVAPISDERKKLIEDRIEANKARQAEAAQEDWEDLPFN